MPEGGTPALYKLLLPREDRWTGTGIQNIAAGAVLAPFALAAESVAAIHATTDLVLALAYLALVVAVAGFILWYHLLDISGATTASSYHFLMSPLGLVFSWIVLHEHEAVPIAIFSASFQSPSGSIS